MADRSRSRTTGDMGHRPGRGDDEHPGPAVTRASDHRNVTARVGVRDTVLGDSRPAGRAEAA